MHPACCWWWAFTLHTSDSNGLESSEPRFKSTSSTVQAQPKLSHCYCNKAMDWHLHPCPGWTQEGRITDLGSSLQAPNIGRCAQLLVSRQGDFHRQVNLCHSLSPIIKVSYFRTMAEELEKEDKGNDSSLSPAFAKSTPSSTVTITNFFLTEMVISTVLGPIKWGAHSWCWKNVSPPMDRHLSLCLRLSFFQRDSPHSHRKQKPKPPHTPEYTGG